MNLQNILNNCVRKTIHFTFNGHELTAQLNLTLYYMNALTFKESSYKGIRISNSKEQSLFNAVESYLKQEGFFEYG